MIVLAGKVIDMKHLLWLILRLVTGRIQHTSRQPVGQAGITARRCHQNPHADENYERSEVHI